MIFYSNLAFLALVAVSVLAAPAPEPGQNPEQLLKPPVRGRSLNLALRDPVEFDIYRGRYEECTRIGKGTSGTVYDCAFGKTRVAVKECWEDPRDPDSVVWFKDCMREPKILTALKEIKGITHLIDSELRTYDSGQRQFLMSMELGRGKSLAWAIDDLQYPHGESGMTLRLNVLEVAYTLKSMARRGWVHGDVKPDNLVFMDTYSEGQPRGELRLIDMGSAQYVGEVDPKDKTKQWMKLDRVVGTPDYVPPSISNFVDESLQDPLKRDVWAYGQTVYTMLTGQPAEYTLWSSFLKKNLDERKDYLMQRAGIKSNSPITRLLAEIFVELDDDRPTMKQVVDILKSTTQEEWFEVSKQAGEARVRRRGEPEDAPSDCKQSDESHAESDVN
ncbi:Uu.00g035600.m01.CDS01 [Anthostomella pinea]|uniref:Uu.00g035600.m01.CDS01 n=1 Tax=Anthostomella pinea TaxID=933095 RepID=A0AAI8V9S8_9PEZI|nr:Uu.00g035600.m01.CDS01 [Anthostomella pinea]